MSFRHASFTRANLQAGRLAVAAVGAWGASELDGADEMAYAVRERLIAHDPALEVLPIAEVRKGFAPGQYAGLIRQLYDRPQWLAQDFYDFHWLTNQVRYLLFVTIVDTDVFSGDSYEGGWHDEPDWGSARNTYSTRSYFTPYTATRYTHRWTKAAFLVYDLQIHQPVWEVVCDSSLHTSKFNSSPAPLTSPPPGPGLISLIGGLDSIAIKAVEKLPK